MNRNDTCWRELIAESMLGKDWSDEPGRKHPVDPGPIIACTLSEAALDERFDAGFGAAEGKPFTAWTAARVYFPTEYDGAEGVGSAPRNPCDEATVHQ